MSRVLSQHRHVAQRGCTPSFNISSARKVAPKRVTAAQASLAAFPQWDLMWNDLVRQEVRSVAPDAAMDMVATGEWVLVDVRPKELFEKSSCEGAVNVPLFQGMDFSQATPASLLKAAAYVFNGVQPVERNPSFNEQVKSLSNGKKVIVFCEAGGTLKPSSNFMTGKPSRSLKAAWAMVKEDLAPEVAHLDGGIFAWYKAEAPMTGTYDTSNVGRTPNAASEPTLEQAMKK